jgi:tetraacyldisaccharide 4'-kinase
VPGGAMSLEAHLQRRWYGRPGWLWLLLPLEILYRGIVALRRGLYRFGLLPAWRAPVPVVVVGNIAVGGTGKTPIVIALCEALRKAGFTPGVISRGYGAQPPETPFLVTPSSSVRESGDEPLLIARRTGCPVAIAPRRAHAARLLLEQARCDILIADDGLQHYALARDVEWVVIDGSRGIGNGHCLPVGPLREPQSRLHAVSAILVNCTAASACDVMMTAGSGSARHDFELHASTLVHLATGSEVDAVEWCTEHARVHAVAGIGNPQRFFATLRGLGCEPVEHAFADHHPYAAADLRFAEALPVVMTEKDAVKCAAFAGSADLDLWFLRVDARLPDSLLASITGKLRAR